MITLFKRSLVTFTNTPARIATISLNKPLTRNAFDKDQLSLLSAAIHQALVDNPRVLLLTSALPGIFCAGADLKERSTLSNHQVHLFVSQLRRVLQELAVRIISPLSLF